MALVMQMIPAGCRVASPTTSAATCLPRISGNAAKVGVDTFSVHLVARRQSKREACTGDVHCSKKKVRLRAPRQAGSSQRLLRADFGCGRKIPMMRVDVKSLGTMCPRLMSASMNSQNHQPTESKTSKLKEMGQTPASSREVQDVPQCITAAPSTVTKRTMLASLGALSLCNSCLGKADALVDEKKRNLSIEEIKDIIERDMRVGKYFVTGDLTREIYNENCRFKDPNNDTKGVEKYLQAISILFDPKMSTLELKSIQITSPKTVETMWDLQGYLKFPWKPKVGTSGSTTYTVDDDGLIILHDEKWAISPFKALLDSFTPSAGPPAT